VTRKVLRRSGSANPEVLAMEVLTAAGHEFEVVLAQRASPDGMWRQPRSICAEHLPCRLVTTGAGLLYRSVVDTILKGRGSCLGVVEDNQFELKEASDEWVEPHTFPSGTEHALDDVRCGKRTAREEPRVVWLID
jgi:hypothetical protein